MTSDLPRGWCTVRFLEATSETRIGLVRSASEQSAVGGCPYVRMQHYDAAGTWNFEDLTCVEVTDAEAKAYELQAGDVLFNTRNSFELVGKVAIWPEGKPGHVFNNNLMRIRFRAALDPVWAGLQMIAPDFREKLGAARSATTSICAIYGRDLFRQPLVVAPLNEHRRQARSTASAQPPRPRSARRRPAAPRKTPPIHPRRCLPRRPHQRLARPKPQHRTRLRPPRPHPHRTPQEVGRIRARQTQSQRQAAHRRALEGEVQGAGAGRRYGLAGAAGGVVLGHCRGTHRRRAFDHLRHHQGRSALPGRRPVRASDGGGSRANCPRRTPLLRPCTRRPVRSFCLGRRGYSCFKGWNDWTRCVCAARAGGRQY